MVTRPMFSAISATAPATATIVHRLAGFRRGRKGGSCAKGLMSGTTAGPAGSSSSSTCAARIGEASATQDGGGGGGGGGGSASDVSLFGASDSTAATTLRAPRSPRSRPVTSSGGPWNQLCLHAAHRTFDRKSTRLHTSN